MSGRPRAVVAVVGIVAVSTFGAVAGARAFTDDGGNRAGTTSADGGTFEHDVTIGPGTAAAIRAGEDVSIVPRELLVHVGETIRITNHDSEDHVVGAFFVAAGETLTQRFTSAGVLEGACSIHPTGRFTVRVEA